ncbi:hypothetical protein H4582DRAFT_2062594 [Lactarius indigo]|nr:hypothetical protein H4582DRAFT_2062594 [Lactarius indigo]
MGRKGPSELTKHEVQLLTIAAKFMAAMKCVEETGPSPMELDIMDTKINQEVRTINSIFAGYGIHSKTPRVHPIIQVIGTEWQSAAIEDRYPDWFILTTEYITTLCEYVLSENPDWHLKLSSLDLNSYLDGLHPSKMWWLEENTIPQMPSEYTFVGPPGRCSIQTPHCSICAARNEMRFTGQSGRSIQNGPTSGTPLFHVSKWSRHLPLDPHNVSVRMLVILLPMGMTAVAPASILGMLNAKPRPISRSIACVKCAQRHKPCEPPATWAIPLHRAMEARSTPSMGAGSPGSCGDSHVDALERKVESLTSKLGDVTQTVDQQVPTLPTALSIAPRDLVNVRSLGTVTDSHDTRLMVGKLLSHQGIESTSIPGVGMPPTNRRSVSPGVQSTSSVGAHMSGLTLSDIRPPSSLSSAPPSRSRQPSGESVASGGLSDPIWNIWWVIIGWSCGLEWSFSI